MRELLSAEQIRSRINEIAVAINTHYQGEELALVIVMKGAVFLAADLMRQLKLPCTLDCVRASSYGIRGSERGGLTLFGLEELTLLGKNVLVVDDIYDSGNTLFQIISSIKQQQPRSLRSLVLLKKEVARQIEYTPDYVLFEIKEAFVVGYGLDYKERYRELPGIFIMEQEDR